jgi:hypothetical protein
MHGAAPTGSVRPSAMSDARRHSNVRWQLSTGRVVAERVNRRGVVVLKTLGAYFPQPYPVLARPSAPHHTHTPGRPFPRNRNTGRSTHMPDIVLWPCILLRPIYNGFNSAHAFRVLQQDVRSTVALAPSPIHRRGRWMVRLTPTPTHWKPSQHVPRCQA